MNNDSSFLNTISEIILLRDCLNDTIENPSQENIDILSERLKVVDVVIELMKNSIATTLKSVVNPENDEIDGGETENGIVL